MKRKCIICKKFVKKADGYCLFIDMFKIKGLTGKEVCAYCTWLLYRNEQAELEQYKIRSKYKIRMLKAKELKKVYKDIISNKKAKPLSSQLV